jgi:hypothetical protein
MFWKIVDFKTGIRNRMPESGEAGESHRTGRLCADADTRTDGHRKKHDIRGLF